MYRSQRIGKSKDDEELAGYRDTLHIGHITAQFLTNLLDSVAANRFVHIAQLRVIYRAFGNRCARSPVCRVVMNSFSSGTQA